MSEINIELKRLKNSLEKLESYSSDIGKAKETANSIIENINKIQTSYSDSIVTIEKELNDIVATNKPLTEELARLIDNLEKVNFPSRLDKIESLVSVINMNVMNIQNKLNHTEKDLKIDLGNLAAVIEKNQKANEYSSVQRKGEIEANKNLLVVVIVLLVLTIIISLAS
jgi:ABC-type transporter Mla subunit MlaD